MRRGALSVRCTPVPLIRRPPLPAHSTRPTSAHRRHFGASRLSRAQNPSPPPPPQSDHSPPSSSASSAPKSTATEPSVILRHSISAYRFIHATVVGQLSVAFTVSPLILADEQFVLNPTAPWLAFGLPAWATAQWLLWRWFVRHWVVEIRTLPGPVYEFDTISRAFSRVKTRVLKPADFVSRERVTANTSILRVNNPKGYFLLNRREEKLLKYNYDGVEEMLDPLPDQLALEAAAKAPAVDAEKRQQLEAQIKEAAAEYRPFKREPKPSQEKDTEEKPKPGAGS